MRALSCALLLAACDGGPMLPGPLPGGGADDFDPGMAQSIAYVIDARDVPIVGAEVYAGPDLIGTTDEDGSVRFEGIGYALTAVAGDRAATVYHPYARAITIPIFDVEPPRAIVNASLEGFGSIAYDGDYLIARAGFTRTSRIVGRENAVVPIEDQSVECEGETCAVRLATRIGALRVFLAIAQGFDEGELGDRSDDRLEPVALAVTELAELAEGEERTLPLTLLAADEVVAVEITPDESPPGGFSAVVGVPGALTGAGVLVWPPELGPRALIPRAIDGETAAHWAIGEALPTPVAAASAIRRGLTLTGGTEASADLPMPPDSVSVADRAVTMQPYTSGEDVLVTFEILDASGELGWIAYAIEAPSLLAPTFIALPPGGRARATVIRHREVGEISFGRVEETWTERASRSVAFGPECPWASCE